jgi:endoglucanase
MSALRLLSGPAVAVFLVLSLAAWRPSAGLANPLQGAALYVNPDSNAGRQASRWRQTRPADAAAMDKIAAQPQAAWFGDWSGDVRAAVAARVIEARAAGAVPVLVVYDIPKRDCGGFSAGGARSAGVYRSWIRRFAAGLGQAPAVVVLEPDALPALDCLKRRERKVRLRLLAYAVAKFRSNPNLAIYLDAGNAGWRPAPVIASRLRAAGVRRARGFSLNVSNFDRTASEIAYGKSISARVGRKAFVIDTSRNGTGPTRKREWCNPRGRALGVPPTVRTGAALVDAFLWVKPPGESDGRCNGGPTAGVWWPEYALGLAKRAAW